MMEPAQPIAFVPQAATATTAGATQPGAAPSAARPDSIARFQTMMFAPDGAAGAAPTTTPATAGSGAVGRVQGWAEGVSAQWQNFDVAIQRMTTSQNLTPQELLSMQHQLLKASVSLELTSKSAGVVERDVQTLIQRN